MTGVLFAWIALGSLPQADHGSNAYRAEELTARIQTQYWQPQRKLYRAYVGATATSDRTKVPPAFAWDLAVQMSALAAACKSAPSKYRQWFVDTEEGLQAYGSTYRGVFGYGVLPRADPPDRYYDDDEWIALAQLDAYDALHEPGYLSAAQKTFDFVLSGESPELDGGIFWREKERTSKNTCSNAPACLAAARLYLETKSKRYLTLALNLHQWLQRLKDTDGLMFDNINLQAKIDRTKWTYNSALMIRADIALYRATGQKEFLTEAVAIATSSAKRWVDASSGVIHDEGPFAHHLSEAFLDLSDLDHSMPWRLIATRAIGAAYGLSTANGMYGPRWDRRNDDNHKLILLYQASMARALWVASRPN